MVKVDYHTHNSRCGHASGGIEDYILSAIKQGFTEIGISDHSPFFHLEQDFGLPGMVMAKSEFPSYIEECIKLKDKYKSQIKVRVGIEADFFEGQSHHYTDTLNDQPLDYIIGSIHYVNGVHIFDKSRWRDPDTDPVTAFNSYYDQMISLVKSDFCDIIAHPDAFLAFAPPIYDQCIEDKKEQLLSLIGEKNLTVEINTSGIRKYGEPFPKKETIKKLHQYGAVFTFGSDSHSPDEVGYEYDLVVNMIREIGVYEWAVFNGRKRSFLEIL
ncbi:histidinol-phosphatase [Jeotgalibacillus sp. JSM ZJ347]|uniref:histidinol-phosphatase n=1 Tax=Jeotgalibacillus sp. JSM ZJ347 TaxID=3342117 RepID=UPI0035A889C6